MQYVHRPIERWPRPETRSRVRSQFDTPFSQTLKLLERELRMLSAKQIVIQVDLSERDIRQDGMIRADARQPRTPRVIVGFVGKHGPMQYPCDRYTNWQDNIRAIALALEALRAVDRHGVTSSGEQYRGWRALPGGEVPGQAIPMPDGAMTAWQAAKYIASHAVERLPGATEDGHAQVLVDAASRVLSGTLAAQTLYRIAVKKLHPDANGGATLPTWTKLQQAVEVIRKYHDRGQSNGH